MRELLRRWGTSPGSIAFAVVSTLLISLRSPPGRRIWDNAGGYAVCTGLFLAALLFAWILQQRRDRLDREAEARDKFVRGEHRFHVLIQLPQQVGQEDALRSALDLPTREVHRGIEPLMKAMAKAEAARIEVVALKGDEALEVYASDVMRAALNPFNDEKQNYREMSEAKREGHTTLVTWLLLVRLPHAPAPRPPGSKETQAWLEALIPLHPADTLACRVACSVPLDHAELAKLARGN